MINATSVNMDFIMPGGKPFNNSSIKMAKSVKEGIETRGAELDTFYKKIIQDDIIMWRITAHIPYSEDLRVKTDLVKSPHDVCLNVVHDTK